jgi:hypothetical protein
VILEGYVEGICRNEGDKVRSHLYKEVDGNVYPMCGYGWNRSNGTRLSVFMGHSSAKGTCRRCLDNMNAGKAPVTEGWEHRTKWI